MVKELKVAVDYIYLRSILLCLTIARDLLRLLPGGNDSSDVDNNTCLVSDDFGHEIEDLLAKDEVAGSSPVFRSNKNSEEIERQKRSSELLTSWSYTYRF